MSLLCRLWLLMLATGLAMMIFGWSAARAEGGGPDRSLSPPFRDIHAPRVKAYTLAQATPDSEWVKQVLRLEYTTFCQAVKKPPQPLVDAINEAVKQDPKTWMPVVIWFNAIAEKYQKAGCGDA